MLIVGAGTICGGWSYFQQARWQDQRGASSAADIAVSCASARPRGRYGNRCWGRGGPSSRRWRCPRCGHTVAATSPHALRTSRDRHLGEVHHVVGRAVAEKCRAQQRDRQTAQRGSALAAPACGAEAWLISITGPHTRARLWGPARETLLQAGCLVASLRRRVVFDMSERNTRCPQGLSASTFLFWDFHRRWLPWPVQIFRRSPRVRVIAWAEDDLELSVVSPRRRSWTRVSAARRTSCG